ncbi:trichohyalin-like isoform X2 [Ruditapes philippinarum]|uniref:trichohyalin-like isoform X2 n=1 Tax=Ruditapes philippinarum TaxID=129788 RepID=UPI00295B01E2|nr:trichohyalin-like isoform X2 [Ruditapes philippinarum]
MSDFYAKISGAKFPTVFWAQRNDVLYLTICVEDCQNPTINLTEQKLTFSGKGGTNKDLYEISLQFEKEVNPQESRYEVQARNISFVIKKKESGPYWPRLLKGIKKAFWLKTDFDKWKDEDESDDDMDKNMDLAEMSRNDIEEIKKQAEGIRKREAEEERKMAMEERRRQASGIITQPEDRHNQSEEERRNTKEERRNGEGKGRQHAEEGMIQSKEERKMEAEGKQRKHTEEERTYIEEERRQTEEETRNQSEESEDEKHTSEDRRQAEEESGKQAEEQRSHTKEEKRSQTEEERQGHTKEEVRHAEVEMKHRKEERKQTEEERRKTEKEMRHTEEEKRQAEETSRQAEEERMKHTEEENLQAEETQRQAEERLRQAEKERRQAEETRRQAEEERRQAEETRRQAEEERRQAEETQRQAEEERRKHIENERRHAYEERRRQAYEERRQAEEQERRKMLEEVEPRNTLEKCVGGLLAVGAVAATMFVGYKLIKAITKEKEPEQRSNTALVRQKHPLQALQSNSARCVTKRDPFQESAFERLKNEKDERRSRFSKIGVNFDEWQIPKKLGCLDLYLAKEICDASETEFNIVQEDWYKATGAVNKILLMLFVKIRDEASKYGLIIEKYVKQGSSREGLKVHAADEFDVLLQYRFKDLNVTVENKSLDDCILPELANLRVNAYNQTWLTHPKLHDKGVFKEIGGRVYLNARQLHEKVFKSIIATSSSVVERNVNSGEHREKV